MGKNPTKNKPFTQTHLVAVVHQDEEEVEAAHDGGGQVDVLLQALAAVVAAADGVGRCQDGRASVQGRLKPQKFTFLCSFHHPFFNFKALRCYLHSGFGDADGLLLHGLVDGHLVFDVHLVELINAAHPLKEDVFLF